MNGNQWRDPLPVPCPDCGFEWPEPRPVPERSVLVERLCRAERRALVAETALRAVSGDRDGVTALAVENVEQRVTIERLNRRIIELNQRRTA